MVSIVEATPNTQILAQRLFIPRGTFVEFRKAEKEKNGTVSAILVRLFDCILRTYAVTEYIHT